jgi:hypothetical protein
LLYKQGEGYPRFDQKRAKLYMSKVAAKIKDEILALLKKWEKLE